MQYQHIDKWAHHASIDYYIQCQKTMTYKITAFCFISYYCCCYRLSLTLSPKYPTAKFKAVMMCGTMSLADSFSVILWS